MEELLNLSDALLGQVDGFDFQLFQADPEGGGPPVVAVQDHVSVRLYFLHLQRFLHA